MVYVFVYAFVYADARRSLRTSAIDYSTRPETGQQGNNGARTKIFNLLLHFKPQIKFGTAIHKSGIEIHIKLFHEFLKF